MSTLILSFCHLCCRESSGESQWLSSTRREASYTGRTSASWLWVSSLPSGITISTFLQLTGTRDTKHRVLPHDCFLIHVAESLHTLTIYYYTVHCLKGSLVCEASVKTFSSRDSSFRRCVCFSFKLFIVHLWLMGEIITFHILDFELLTLLSREAHM